MNKVEFRAWDKKNNKMYDILGFYIMPDKCFIYLLTVSGEIGTFEEHLYSDIILLQYTGLKDKNGKNIYEGDIVRVENYHIVGDGQEVTNGSFIGVVKYNINTASFRIKTDHLNQDCIGESDSRRFSNTTQYYEILGNKYDLINITKIKGHK